MVDRFPWKMHEMSKKITWSRGPNAPSPLGWPVVGFWTYPPPLLEAAWITCHPQKPFVRKYSILVEYYIGRGTCFRKSPEPCTYWTLTRVQTSLKSRGLSSINCGQAFEIRSFSFVVSLIPFRSVTELVLLVTPIDEIKADDFLREHVTPILPADYMLQCLKVEDKTIEAGCFLKIAFDTGIVDP